MNRNSYFKYDSLPLFFNCKCRVSPDISFRRPFSPISRLLIINECWSVINWGETIIDSLRHLQTQDQSWSLHTPWHRQHCPRHHQTHIIYGHDPGSHASWGFLVSSTMILSQCCSVRTNHSVFLTVCCMQVSFSRISQFEGCWDRLDLLVIFILFLKTPLWSSHEWWEWWTFGLQNKCVWNCWS